MVKAKDSESLAFTVEKIMFYAEQLPVDYAIHYMEERKYAISFYLVGPKKLQQVEFVYAVNSKEAKKKLLEKHGKDKIQIIQIVRSPEKV